MSKGFASSYRTGLIAFSLLASFAGVGGRLVWLHVIARDELLRSVAKVRSRFDAETARRGDIVDARDRILATSRSLFVVNVDPSWLREKDETKWSQLAALLGRPLPEVRKILTTKFREPAPANPAAAASTAARPADLVFNLPPSTAAAGVATGSPEPAGAVDPTLAELDAANREPADEPADDTGDEATPDQTGRIPIQWAKLADDIPESVMSEIDRLGIRGVYGTRSYRRTYPHNQLAAHIVGFVNKAQHPIAGLERYADFYLRGHDGWREGERDGRSRELAQFRTREVPPADGYNVKLSINANVQDIIEQELAAIVERYQPLKATIIVSDPRDGFVLGLANYPTFNPNDYNKVPRDEMSRFKNIAVTDIYDPGSVFKIVPASGALEDGLVTPDTVFDCSLEKIEYQGLTRKLPAEDHHFGNLTVAEIIAHSSNRGAAQLAMRLGDERFFAYARAFGFGQVTGLPGGYEEAGIMRPPAKWDSLTITRMPMGQGLSVTPMQMHQAMSVIASGGLLLRPQVVRRISDVSNEMVSDFYRVAVRRVVSERTARTMARLLARVATKDGTAPEAAIPGYEVAGKTGTAQKYIDGKPSTTHHVASFIGFFPASNPQVAISVIVDDADAHAPGGIAYGAKVAAPSFKHIGEQLITYLDIKAGAPAPAGPALVWEGGRR